MPPAPEADRLAGARPGAAELAAAVILAGGSGSRLGGLDKPALTVGGRTLLDTALAAVAGGPVVVVVGPDRGLPPGLIAAREDPPGGGPAAAVAAGVAALPELAAQGLIAVLAADLPGIERWTIDRLCAALTKADPAVGGAVLIDPDGRRQHLIGVWRRRDLLEAVAARQNWFGGPLHELLRPIPVIEVAGGERETADVDTPADWQRWKSVP